MNNLLTINKKLANIKPQSCASALVESLIEHKADKIFGYPGAAVLSIYNELAMTNINHYLVRHEQAAVHAAEGYARVSGKAGVVLVTSGPGFTNTITGIANAYADSTPLVILAGDVPMQNNKGKVFQKVDIESLAKSCTKKTYMVSQKDDIKQIINDAFLTATTAPKGPVVIALPRNVLENNYRPKLKKYVEINPKTDISRDIESFIKILNNSKRPLVIIGNGAISACKEIKNFVTKLNCPVASTLMGIGNYPTSSKNYLGMIGINGNYLANSVINQADLIIALGVSFSDRSTCKNIDYAKQSKIVSVNISKISSDFTLEIQSDVKNFLNYLLKHDFCANNYTNWFNHIEVLKTENISSQKPSEKIKSSFVLETISDLTKKLEPIVVTDVGQHQMLTAQFFNFDKPGKFITSGGMGTMGFGLPASIGAYIANSSNLILNITGDGSFQMNLQELATVREHNIPIKIIIMNNSSLGMVRQLQEKIYKTRYQVEMTNPDFTKIAEAYDLFALRVARKNELIPAIKKALDYPGTAIVDVAIDPMENI